MSALVYLAIGLAVVLEGTVTSLPLVLMSLILVAVYKKTSDVFVLAFVSGVLLDLFLVRQVGESSVFFLITLLFIFLYERKYETTSLLFVGIWTGLSSSLYLLIFQIPYLFVQVITITLLAGLLFSLMHILQRKKQTGRTL